MESVEGSIKERADVERVAAGDTKNPDATEFWGRFGAGRIGESHGGDGVDVL